MPALCPSVPSLVSSTGQAIRQAGRRPEQLRYYAAIGWAIRKARDAGTTLDMVMVADACGWKRANTYQVFAFAQWVDDHTLQQMIRLRSPNGRSPFTWRVIALLTLQTPERRQQLIRQAIDQKLTSRELERLINPTFERPRPKHLREVNTSSLLLPMFDRCLEVFTTDIEAFRSNRPVLAQLERRQPAYVRRFIDQIKRVQHELEQLRDRLGVRPKLDEYARRRSALEAAPAAVRP